MITLSILNCSIEWQLVIGAIPGICWGILGLILICVLLRRVAFPLIANYHEVKLKKENFDEETKWFDKKNKLDELKESTDDGVKELKTKVSELEGKLKIEEFNKELLEKQLKMYSDIFKQLKVEVKPKV
jgi:hypothetical protein